MGNIIPFSNNKTSIKNDDVFVLKSMALSPITAKMRILPQEIHVLMRVLIQERKDVQGHYKDSLAKKKLKETEYWKTIHETLNTLIHKLTSIQKIEEVFQDLTFIELDCLVGSIEQHLQNTYVLALQLIDDDIPLITKALKKIYDNLLPLYEEIRKDFEREQDQIE